MSVAFVDVYVGGGKLGSLCKSIVGEWELSV